MTAIYYVYGWLCLTEWNSADIKKHGRHHYWRSMQHYLFE